MLYIGLAMLFLQLTPQQPQMPRQTPRTPVLQHQEFTWNLPTDTPTSLDGKDYKIGRDDLLEISVFEVAELGAIIRVSATGMISLPLIGQLAAIGETTDGLGALIEAELKKKYVNDPHVTVFVREYASQPVSVVGAVRVCRTVLGVPGTGQQGGPGSGSYRASRCKSETVPLGPIVPG